MKTRKISEVELLESFDENTNVVVEDDGKTRRLPANKLGKVKTVNGVEPDEEGNVEVNIPEGSSGSWNDLTDKPFGETTTSEEVLYEATLGLHLSGNYYSPIETVKEYTGGIEYGENYTVVLDGKTYENVTHDQNEGMVVGPIVIYASTMNNIEVSPSDEPDEATEHTLKIIATSIEISKIDPLWLPSSVVHLYITDNQYLYTDKKCTVKVTKDEFVSLINESKTIYIESGYTYFMPTAFIISPNMSYVEVKTHTAGEERSWYTAEYGEMGA